jgi:(S)-mandelate dehydrogenase
LRKSAAPSKPLNVEHDRTLARKRLPKIIFDYREGGADDETDMAHNHNVFARHNLMPHQS